MEAALPLELVEFDHSVEITGDVSNMSAEEYLSWVRYQANNLPNVKRVQAKAENRQSKYMPAVDDILACPVDCLPSDEWQREVLFAFSQLRQTLETMSEDSSFKERKVAVPAMKDREAWHRFCFASELGSVDVQLSTNAADGASHPEQARDSRSASTAMDESGNENDTTENAEAAARAMLKRKRDLAYDLGITYTNTTYEKDGEEDENNAENGSDDDGSVDGEASLAEDEDLAASVAATWTEVERAMQWTGAVDVEPTTSVLLQFDQVLTQRLLMLQIDWLECRDLTAARGRWLYALLARLEKPLHRETAAAVRQLYRRCCALRYALCQRTPAVPAPTTVHSDTGINASSGGSGGAPDAVEVFQTQLAALNMLISICGSYFGQGEEYDAFNKSLSEQAVEGDEEEGDYDDAEYGDECGDEEGDWGEEDYEAAEAAEAEEEVSEMADSEPTDGGAGGSGGVPAVVPSGWEVRTSAVPAGHMHNQQRAGGAKVGGRMDLEEGEEVEDTEDTGIAKRTKS